MWSEFICRAQLSHNMAHTSIVSDKLTPKGVDTTRFVCVHGGVRLFV